MFKRKAPSAHFQPARTLRLAAPDTTAAQHNLDKADAGGHISLVKQAQSVGEQMQKRGLLGVQMEPWFLVDRSGSMKGYYESGQVQTLVERALAFALLTSPTGTVNVVGFGSTITAPVRVTQDNYRGVIGRDIPHPGWDTTNLTDALKLVRNRAQAPDLDLPLHVTVVADGGADNPVTAKRLFCDLAQYPVFIKLLSVIPVAFFAELDDLTDRDRLLDNIDAKPETGGKPLMIMDDDEFAAAMTDEIDSWIGLATAAGVLTR